MPEAHEFFLEKAPLVQVWIGAVFVPDVPGESQEWDWERAREYLAEFGDSLSTIEFLRAPEIPVVSAEKSRLPREEVTLRIVAARARNDDETEFLVATEFQIIYVSVKPNADVLPRFSSIASKFLEAAQKFTHFFPGYCVDSLELHNTDEFAIPPGLVGSVSLGELFNYFVDVPAATFGSLERSKWGVKTSTNDANDPGELEWDCIVERGEPGESGDEGGTLNCRMEWHRSCLEVHSTDPLEISDRLLTAYRHLKSCFRNSLTSTVWDSFSPRDT